MSREHDTRSKRERELTVEDQRRERLRAAFASAPLIVNGLQAEAIHKLLTTGEQAGEAAADPIPRSVAVTGIGGRADDPLWDATGGADAADGVGPQFQTVGLLAEDGRTWSVTGAGVCWPGGTSFQEARRSGRG